MTISTFYRQRFFKTQYSKLKTVYFPLICFLKQSKIDNWPFFPLNYTVLRNCFIYLKQSTMCVKKGLKSLAFGATDNENGYEGFLTQTNSAKGLFR